MEPIKLFNIKSPILLTKTLSNGQLTIVDSQNTLRIIDPNTYAVAGGFKASIQHKLFIESIVDASMNGEYAISVLPTTHKAAVFNISKKELIYKIGSHSGEIESVAIDPNNRYCFTCGQDGKAFAWVLSTSRLAFSLPSHLDFISTIAFDNRGQWVATGSFDRTINVLNLSTQKHPIRLRGHNSVVMKIVFLPEAKLLSAEKEGALILWDIASGKVIKRLTKMNDDITTMITSPDYRFAFVGTKLGHIGLYDLQTMELVKQRYLVEGEQITSMTFLESPLRLAVGTMDGIVRVYSLFGDEALYMGMLRERQYKAFYDALEDNPILVYGKPYFLAEQIWSDVIEKARAYLEKKEFSKAKELLNMFAGIPRKNGMISQILHDYEKYPQFLTSVNEGRFTLAYSMAKQYPVFKDSEPYRKMELNWRKLFTKAQELINKSNGEDQARTLLAPYRGISEKTVLIQQLFEQRRMYEYFLKVIAQRDYVKFFDLVKALPFLKEFSEYNKIIDYADRVYIQAQKSYTSGEYATAKKACDILVAFPAYAHEANGIIEAIRVKHLFYDAITSNNLLNAFAYLSAYPLLYDIPEAQLLEQQWNLIVDKAQKYAAKGLAAKTLEVFEPYKSIQDKYVAMGSVMAQSYCVQLEHKIRAKESSSVIENGITLYVKTFGIDQGILTVFGYFKNRYETQLDLELLKQGSLESWTPAIQIENICTGI
ncbi:MAG: hypothetical protein PHO27_00515 [Sulfuricurvum sp.]|nr:hypothetical protein [Sulfuricurvum sp.]